jgi:transcription elongation factor Elf1
MELSKDVEKLEGIPCPNCNKEALVVIMEKFGHKKLQCLNCERTMRMSLSGEIITETEDLCNKFLDEMDRVFRYAMREFNEEAKINELPQSKAREVYKRTMYLIKDLYKTVRKVMQHPDFEKIPKYDKMISHTLNSVFENTYNYPEEERKSGIKVNNVRVIESNFKGKPRLSLFYGFFELLRLGEYISYLSKSEAIKLRDFLTEWIERV